MGSTIYCKRAYTLKLLIIALLLQLPLTYALTCNNVAENLEMCNEIELSNVTYTEKQQLIADLVYKDTNIANHSFVFDWNTNIGFSSAPYGVETKSNGYIKDAWLKIVAVMPSVISENKLLTSGVGKVLSAYNYQVEIPSGTEPGDCRTDYSIASNNNWLNVYLNDNSIGISTLVDFEGTDVLNFKDTLKIQTVTEVEHYHTYRWCCEYDRNGGCKRYCEECRYSNTEYRTHEVNLEDTKQAFVYSTSIEPEIKAVDSYHDTKIGILNISNFDAFSLSFENSYFNQFNYNYDIDISLQPYGVFTLRANKFAKKEANNIVVEQSNSSYKFYVGNADNCKINYYDHFNSYEQSCNLDYDFPLFKVQTDKLHYDENETINVSLEPKDTLIKVKYGNEEVLAENNVQFQAKPNNNKITAFLEERKAEKVIHVKRKNIWNFVLNFGVFSGVLYSYYLLLRKYLVWF